MREARAAAVGALVVLGVAGCGGGRSATIETQAAVAKPKPKSAAELKAEKAEQAAEAARERAAKKREAAEARVQHRREARERAHEAAVRKLHEIEGHGLGATKATFESNNTMVSQEGTEPPEGTDYYRITETDSHGRVTGYEVTIYATPPSSNQERIGLLGGVDLPLGTEPLPSYEHSHCYVWRGANLKKLIGDEYAEGTTETGTDTATMEAVSSPRCSA